MRQGLMMKQGFTLTELAFSIAIMSIISVSVSTLLTSAYQAQQTHRITAMVESKAMNFTEQFRRDARRATAVGVVPDSAITPGLINTTALPIDEVTSDSIGITPSGAAVGIRDSGRGIRFYYRRDANQRINRDLFVEYHFTNNNALERNSTFDPETEATIIGGQLLVYVGPQPNGNPDPHDMVVQCMNDVGSALDTGCLGFTNTLLYSTPNQQLPTQTLSAGLTRVTVDRLRIRTAPRNGDAISNDPNALGMMFFPIDAFGQPAYNISEVSFELGGGKVFR